MKNLSLTILLVFVSFFLQADNWELFPFNQKTYFHFIGERNFTNEVFDAISPYYVDVVESQGNLEYQYILKNYVENISEACYEAFASQNDTWFAYGRRLPFEVILVKEGWYGEATRNGSEIIEHPLTIHSLAEVGDKWFIEGDYDSFTHIEISCISKEWQAFIGIEDSVKTFEFQAFQEDLAVNSAFDTLSFRISKKYGLLEGVLLKELLQNEKFTTLQLTGFEDENGNLVGLKAPTLLDFVPNFQVGDILKWYDVYSYPTIPQHTAWFRDSITQVTLTESSLEYTFDRTVYKITLTPLGKPKDTLTYKETSLLQRYESSFEFNQLIELAYYGYGLSSDYESGILMEISTQLQFNELQQDILPILQTRFNSVFLDASSCGFASLTNVDQSTYYTPSLGIYFIDNAFWIGQQYFTQLIGYRIGNEESGDIEPIITNIESPTYFASQITLHPNPTQNRFTLQLQKTKQQLQNLQLKITDIHGRTLQQLPILQSSIEVDLSQQPNGIYLVQISDGESWWTEKVVKY